jgi:hypothetical protein
MSSGRNLGGALVITNTDLSLMEAGLWRLQSVRAARGLSVSLIPLWEGVDENRLFRQLPALWPILSARAAPPPYCRGAATRPAKHYGGHKSKPSRMVPRAWGVSRLLDVLQESTEAGHRHQHVHQLELSRPHDWNCDSLRCHNVRPHCRIRQGRCGRRIELLGGATTVELMDQLVRLDSSVHLFCLWFKSLNS